MRSGRDEKRIPEVILPNPGDPEGHIASGSGALQAFEFDSVGTNLGKIIMRLLRQPAFRAAAEDLGQAHRHFRRYATLSIHKLGQSRAGYTQRGGGAGDRQAKRLNALAHHETAGMGWMFHRHGKISFSKRSDEPL